MRVEDADPPGLRLTVVGDSEVVSPEGETELDRVIVPVNPAKLVRLIVAVFELPAWTVTEPGVDDIVKSPTPTVMVVVWESWPLVAVTVTVYVP